MPIPGPRTQQGPLPGYRNPDHEVMLRFNHYGRPGPVADMGRTPGLMYLSRRGNVLGHGMIRHFWKQAINYIAASAPYSWSSSSPSPGRPGMSYPAVGVTRALRYMTRCISPRAGEDNTHYAGLHTKILSGARQPAVTTQAGNSRSRPTIRNRMTSFGSRVPTLNPPVPADPNSSKYYGPSGGGQ